MNHKKLLEMKEKFAGQWAERILAELEFAGQMAEYRAEFSPIYEKAVNALYAAALDEGAVTQGAVRTAEEILAPMAPEAKKYRAHLVAHAHIDMNWMWGYAETVAITLDTFRTMLTLMEEYPEFTFAQSQASCYRIVEEHDPDMLEEIRQRIREGRWEVSASTWVEADKNLSGPESQARNLLMTKQYLGKLFGLPEDYFTIDFEPDTFGHPASVPEILAEGGVKYYYHCRGYDGYELYRFRAPSGREVLVNREPGWYLGAIHPGLYMHLPEFEHKYGVNFMLNVFGVGDHGGGPTRKDIEMLRRMQQYPVFPTLAFSSYHAYFEALEQVRDRLPVVNSELNCVFTGCYTTQTRIKYANWMGEKKLLEAEFAQVLANQLAGRKIHSLDQAWEKQLFNQFHDILPGSGILETRECAMGEYQKLLAKTNTEISASYRAITAEIDTEELASLDDEDLLSRSEGAGVGFGIAKGEIPQTDRSRGKNRIFHFFNNTPYPRTEVVEIVLWDYPYDVKQLRFYDAQGNPIAIEFAGGNPDRYEQYWQHQYRRIYTEISVPALGYTTVAARLDGDAVLPSYKIGDHRVHRVDKPVLENDKIRAEFDSKTMELVSFVRKDTNAEFISGQPVSYLRLITEQDEGMSSWTIGRYRQVESLHQNVKVIQKNLDPASIKQFITFQIQFRTSSFEVTVSLDKGASALDFHLKCDWRETAVPGETIPQLNFGLRLGNIHKTTYEIPYGYLERTPYRNDVPSMGMAAAETEQGLIMLLGKGKYGYRCIDQELSVTLIRSSCEPDPYPENYIHSIDLRIALPKSADRLTMAEESDCFFNPISFTQSSPKKGRLPVTFSFIKRIENVRLYAVKPSIKDRGLILRFAEVAGTDQEAKVVFSKTVKRAYRSNLLENNAEEMQVEGNAIAFAAPHHTIVTIFVELS